MNQESIDFLKNLIDKISPSGYEKEATEYWKSRTGAFTDKISCDVHGNCIGVLNPQGKPTVMLAGHIDEIGYMVKYIDEDGFIYFVTIGGIDMHLVPGQRVWIKTRKGQRVLGVIGKKPAHLLEETEKKQIATIDQLCIDIGTKNEEETRKLIEVGDVAVPAVAFERLNDDIAIARGFDDRAGAFVVSETLRRLSETKPRASVYGVATVQEEIGLRGAKTSAYGISPDIGIAIDVTFATDYPQMEKKKAGDIKIGGGPVIARGPNMNHDITDLLIKTAEENDIPYQIEAIPRGTGTDANVIQLTKAGVATGLVSIPLRYMHTPVELLSLTDLDNVSKLLAAFITKAT